MKIYKKNDFIITSENIDKNTNEIFINEVIPQEDNNIEEIICDEELEIINKFIKEVV